MEYLRRYYESAQDRTDKETGPQKEKAEAEPEASGKGEEGSNQKEIG
jgi:hypothetical protein